MQHATACVSKVTILFKEQKTRPLLSDSTANPLATLSQRAIGMSLLCCCRQQLTCSRCTRLRCPLCRTCIEHVIYVRSAGCSGCARTVPCTRQQWSLEGMGLAGQMT